MAPLSSSANQPDHRPELQKHFFPFKTTMMILQNKLECLPRARKWQKKKNVVDIEDQSTDQEAIDLYYKAIFIIMDALAE